MFTCFNAGTMFCGARREYLAELNTEAATSPDFHSLLVQLDYLFSLLQCFFFVQHCSKTSWVVAVKWPCELNDNKKRHLWSTSCFLLCPEGVLKPLHVILELYLPFIFFVLLPYKFLQPVQEDKVLILHCFHAEKRTLYSACVLLFFRKQDSGSSHPNRVGALLDRLICSCRSFQILSRTG